MTHAVDLAADPRLAALIDRVRGGEDVVVTDHGAPVARIVPMPPNPPAPRRPGTGIGKVRLNEGYEDDLPPDLFEALRP